MRKNVDPMATVTAFLEQVIRALDEGNINVLNMTDPTRDNAVAECSLTYHDHMIHVWETGTITIDGIDMDGRELFYGLHGRLMTACLRRANVQDRAARDRRFAAGQRRKKAEQKARIVELAGKLRL